MATTGDIQVAAGGTALADAIEHAPAGARLCLAAGEHVAGVALVRSITLVGQGADKTVLKGPGRLPVLRIEDDGLAVRIQGVTLEGGESDAGGGLSIRGRGKVQVVECRFTGNRAGLVGGGGLYATAGLLTVERSRFDHNHGRQGGGLFLDAVVHAELTRCDFDANEADLGGGARISEGVQADFKAGTFHDNRAGGLPNALHVSGTHSRVPHVTLDHTHVLDGALVNGPDVPGSIRLKACRVPGSWRGIPGVVDTGGTIHANP
jgi:predicted outer membrane repeat protein